jgi:hypothetical protein
MRTPARIYVCAVLAAAVALALYAAMGPRSADPVRMSVYLALGALASLLKVRLPGMDGTISASFVVLLVAVAECTLAETVAIGLVSALIQSYWHAAKRPLPIQAGFNMAVFGLSAGAAHAVANTLVPRDLLPAFLAVAATVYFLLNTLAVATVLGLISQRSILAIWQEAHAKAFPYYLIGAGVASIMVTTQARAGWAPSIAVFPSMLLAWMWYRNYTAVTFTSGSGR